MLFGCVAFVKIIIEIVQNNDKPILGLFQPSSIVLSWSKQESTEVKLYRECLSRQTTSSLPPMTAETGM